MFPVVLFDLDGTLVDSAQLILASFHHATETVLQRRFPDEQILAQVGGTNLETQMARLDSDPAPRPIGCGAHHDRRHAARGRRCGATDR